MFGLLFSIIIVYGCQAFDIRTWHTIGSSKEEFKN
jgi:hypothetical protein